MANRVEYEIFDNERPDAIRSRRALFVITCQVAENHHQMMETFTKFRIIRFLSYLDIILTSV